MLKSISFAFFFRLSNSVLLIFLTPLLLIKYDDIYFSKFAIISFIIVSIPLFDCGLTKRLIRDLNKAKSIKDYNEKVKIGANLFLFLSVLIFVIIFFLSDLITNSTPLLNMSIAEKIYFSASVQLSFISIYFKTIMEVNLLYLNLGAIRLIHNTLFLSIFLINDQISNTYIFIMILKIFEISILRYHTSINFFSFVNLVKLKNYFFSSYNFALLSFLPVILANAEKFTVTNTLPLNATTIITISEILLKFTMLSGVISGVFFNYFSKNIYSDFQKKNYIKILTITNILIYLSIFLICFFKMDLIINLTGLTFSYEFKIISVTYLIISFLTSLTTPLVALNLVNEKEKIISNFYLIMTFFLIFFLNIVGTLEILLLVLLIRVIIDIFFHFLILDKNV